MIRVIFNRKGGVGKSTLTCNLSAAASRHGRKVLVVDIDAQANSSSYLQIDGGDEIIGMPEYFESCVTFNYSQFKPENYVRKTRFENLHLISSHAGLTDHEQKLESRHKIYKLRDFLRELAAGFDEIYIDTPPAYNFFSLSALIAADRVLIPFDCDDFSREALKELLQNIREVREDHNQDLGIEGIIINQFQSRARFPREAVEGLREFNIPILEPYISSSVRIRESHRAARPMVYYDPSHKLSGEFRALYENLNH